jgi:predicted S18 family serine protease
MNTLDKSSIIHIIKGKEISEMNKTNTAPVWQLRDDIIEARTAAISAHDENYWRAPQLAATAAELQEQVELLASLAEAEENGTAQFYQAQAAAELQSLADILDEAKETADFLAGRHW